jgi:hypothetical protein
MSVGRRREPVGGRQWHELVGRRRECAALDGLLRTVLARGSQALVVHGEPGVGKTVLLDYLASRARGCRVARAVGVQSEMELAFAGLHQLCAEMLDHLDRIPAPQRDAFAHGVRYGYWAASRPIFDRSGRAEFAFGGRR